MEAFDVVVVGSGFGGAIAGEDRGCGPARVLLLERGRRYRPGDVRHDCAARIAERPLSN
jgi:choline dehydrogenase-like flavoprotein